MSESSLKRLPIGMSDWDDFHSEDYFFVDKTEILFRLVDKRKVFIARPRRMGKTTLCIMLEALFTRGASYFEGTPLYDKLPKNIGPYPVISISFIDVVGEDQASFEQSLIGAMVAAYDTAGFPEVADFESASNGSLDRFLKKLVPLSARHHLVFLIDEWDHLLSSNLDDKVKFQEAHSVLKQFYAWLRRLRHVRFILVTGIMRYRYLSLFTGQDIRDVSMDPTFAPLLGYTHEELVTCFAPYITEAAKRRGESPEELIAGLKAYYDGFCFDKEAKIKLFSPWDINQFFEPVSSSSSTDGVPEFEPYWMTSSNAAEALRAFLRRRQVELKEILALKHQDVIVSAAEMSNPVDFNVVKLHPLMVETGFLTIKERITQGLYRCGLPNLSVEQEFDSVLSEYLMMTIGQEQANVLTAALSKYLKQGAIKQACVTINELLCSLRYDTFQHAHEAWYRTLLTIWLRAAADNANDVREETGNYQGRSDIELNIGNRAYVFELKLIHNNSEQDNKRSYRSKYHLLETATKQILSKGYAVNSYTAGLPVTGVVLVISNKRRRIVAWRQFDASSDTCGRLRLINLSNKYVSDSTQTP